MADGGGAGGSRLSSSCSGPWGSAPKAVKFQASRARFQRKIEKNWPNGGTPPPQRRQHGTGSLRPFRTLFAVRLIKVRQQRHLAAMQDAPLQHIAARPACKQRPRPSLSWQIPPLVAAGRRMWLVHQAGSSRQK